MEESVLFPLEKKTRVKPGTVLIETVLSEDSLYTYSEPAELGVQGMHNLLG